MVSVQYVDRSTSRRRFFRKTPKQIQDRLFVVASVQKIPSLHDNQVATGPVILTIDCPGDLEHAARRIEVTV
jgi:hypothetical protein